MLERARLISRPGGVRTLPGTRTPRARPAALAARTLTGVTLTRGSVPGAGSHVAVPYISRLVPGGVRVASCRKRAMKILVRILVTAVALAVAAWLVPGIHTEQWTLHGTSAVSNDASVAKTLIIVAVIFGLINAIIKPIIKAVGCAFYVLTLGLIAIVVNGALLYLTSYIVYDKLHQPFHVTSFLAAVEGALIVGVVTWVAHLILRDED
jgi:putative membrane protein